MDNIDFDRLRQRRQAAKAFLNLHRIDPDDLQSPVWAQRFADAYPQFARRPARASTEPLQPCAAGEGAVTAHKRSTGLTDAITATVAANYLGRTMH